MANEDLDKMCRKIQTYNARRRFWETETSDFYPLNHNLRMLVKYESKIREAETVLADYLDWT